MMQYIHNKLYHFWKDKFCSSKIINAFKSVMNNRNIYHFIQHCYCRITIYSIEKYRRHFYSRSLQIIWKSLCILHPQASYIIIFWFVYKNLQKNVHIHYLFILQLLLATAHIFYFFVFLLNNKTCFIDLGHYSLFL